MKTTLLTSVALLTSTVCAVDSQLALRHRESQGVGYNKGYSTLDYFLTTQGERWEFLYNLRGHLFNDGRAAGNMGIGFRYSLNQDKSRLGANLFYDLRDYSHFMAQQAGVGLEWISRSVDIRANGYLPLGRQRSFKEQTQRGFSGNAILVDRKFSATLPTVEAEIGTALAKPFYFAAGAYYLFREAGHTIKVGQAMGWKARFDVNMGDYFTLGALVTHDKIFNTRVQGYLSLNIPLGPWKKTKDGSRDLRHVPIMRNEIIPIQTRKDARTPLITDEGGVTRIFFVNNAAPVPGDGTFEHPFKTLKEAEKASDAGDIIYVFPGTGTPHGMDEGIVLKKDQVLASSGATLEVEDVVIPPQTPGQNPVLTNIHENEFVVKNPGSSNLNNFYYMNPWDYLQNFDFQPFSIDHASYSPAVSETVSNHNSPWNEPGLRTWVDLGNSTPQVTTSQGGGLWNTVTSFIPNYSGQGRQN